MDAFWLFVIGLVILLAVAGYLIFEMVRTRLSMRK